jgi:hypothetical protein
MSEIDNQVKDIATLIGDLERDSFSKAETGLLKRYNFKVNELPDEFTATHSDLLNRRDVDFTLYKLEEAVSYIRQLNKGRSP